MKLKYLDYYIKELRYENALVFSKEDIQENNIQINLGIDKEFEFLSLEVNSDIKTLNKDNITQRKIDLSVIYNFDIIKDNDTDDNNIELCKEILDKDIPIYLHMFNETVKRITALDYSIPISVIDGDFDFNTFSEQ